MFLWKKNLTEVIDGKIIDYKFGHSFEKNFFRAGLIGTFGIMLIIFGFFHIYHSMNENNSYSMVETPPKQVLTILNKRLDASDQTSLILFRNDCPACKKVETHLVKKVIDLKEKGASQFVVIDLKKLSHNQLNELKEIIPGIVVDGNKIPTPLVANLKSDGTIFKIKNKSTNTDIRRIDQVLKESEEG